MREIDAALRAAAVPEWKAGRGHGPCWARGRRTTTTRSASRSWASCATARSAWTKRPAAQARAEDAPKLSIAHYYLGAILFRQGDSSGAERAYREADQLAPEDPRALTARCQIHAHQGNEAAVAEVKQELATRFPDRADALAAECSTGK